MDKDRALRKVQKLMAIVKDGRGNANEAERALAQAEAMMREFGISEAEVGSTGAASATFDWGSDFAPYGEERQPAKVNPLWFQYLAVGVGVFTDTIVRNQYSAARGAGVGFYGERSDVALAVWLADYLKRAVWRAMRASGLPRGGANEEFRKAMALRLQERMRQLRAERDAAFAAAPGGTALVVVTDKLARRDAEFGGQQYGAKRRVDFRSAVARAAGRAAADAVPINRPLSGPAAAGALQ